MSIMIFYPKIMNKNRQDGSEGRAFATKPDNVSSVLRTSEKNGRAKTYLRAMMHMTARTHVHNDAYEGARRHARMLTHTHMLQNN